MIDVPNGTMQVQNPTAVLRNAEGVFEVISPFGHVFHVNCRRGTKMFVRAISEPERVEVSDRLWRIRRIDRNVA